MAVPKNRRSRAKVKQRTNIIFFDQLHGNWLRRREWFYKRLSVQHYLPKCSEGTFSKINRPILFPGFWPYSVFPWECKMHILTKNSRLLHVFYNHKSVSSTFQQRRCLGQAPVGKKPRTVTDIWDETKALLTKPSLSYSEFARRVEATRGLLFWGLVFGLSINLIINPLESRYWGTLLRFKGLRNQLPTAPLKLGNDYMTDASREYFRKCNV
ncbi:hypothetical protein BdWA1_003163 [Babesia duncani]|uniref:Uncharacterized protein n=1 Tax=Babesia duncani TaxID=323732 RepID=A0AAD9PIH4_9APIC|nr:hypothetical protein BdWA1_003163 [Babesia duncani]